MFIYVGHCRTIYSSLFMNYPRSNDLWGVLEVGVPGVPQNHCFSLENDPNKLDDFEVPQFQDTS
jgi:hypothetical protein